MIEEEGMEALTITPKRLISDYIKDITTEPEEF